jgi:hypothetical protein
MGVFDDYYGVKKNRDGFVSSVKRSGASMVGGLGEIYADVTGDTEHDNALTRFDDRVQANNPSEINSLQDIADSPWLAMKVAAGSAAGLIGPGLVGKGLGAAGNALKMSRLARTGEAINSFGAQTALAGLPSVRAIGEQQRLSGEDENDLLKYAASAAVGGIETKFGIQKMLGVGSNAPRAGLRQVVSEFGKSPIRTGLKTAGASMLGEGGEELLQNPVEQYAGFQDPTSPESLEQTAFGGAMGALGGLAFGAAGGARRGLQHRGVRNSLITEGYVEPGAQTPTDLLQGLENRDYQNYIAPIQEEARRDQMYREDPLAAAEGVGMGGGDLQGAINKNVGVNGVSDSRRAEMQRYYDSLAAEKTGRFAADPATGLERELTFGEEAGLFTADEVAALSPVQRKTLVAAAAKQPTKQQVKNGTRTAQYTEQLAQHLEDGVITQAQYDEDVALLKQSRFGDVRKRVSMYNSSDLARKNIYNADKTAKAPVSAVSKEAQSAAGVPAEVAPPTSAPPAKPKKLALPKGASEEDVLAYKAAVEKDMTAYKAAVTPWLLSGVTPDEMRALDTKQKLSDTVELDEDSAVSTAATLRAAAKELGVSYETVRKRVVSAEAKIAAAAKKAGFTLDTAHELMGMQSSFDIDADAAGVSGGFEGVTRVPVTGDYAGAAMDDFTPDMGSDRAAIDAEGAATVDETENVAVGDAVDAVSGMAMTDAEESDLPASQVDHNGQPIRAVDIEDARLDWKALDGTDLPKELEIQWTKLWIANQDGVLNDKIFHQQYLALTTEADKLRGVPQVGGADAQKSEGRPKGEGSPAPAQPAASTGKPARKRAKKSEPAVAAPKVDKEKVWQESWDEQVASDVIPTWSNLSDSQRSYLLKATEAEQGDAVNAVIDELTRDPYEAPEPKRERYIAYKEEAAPAPEVKTLVKKKGKKKLETDLRSDLSPSGFSLAGMTGELIDARTDEADARVDPTTGRTTRTYKIYNKDGTQVGYTILTFKEDGTVATLEDIELDSKHRSKGYAYEVLDSLTKTYGEIFIHNIQDEALEKWVSYGIGPQELDSEGSNNADLTRAGFEASEATERKNARGNESSRESRPVQDGDNDLNFTLNALPANPGRRKFIARVSALALGAAMPRVYAVDDFKMAARRGDIRGALQMIASGGSSSGARALANRLIPLLPQDISMRVIREGATYKESFPGVLAQALGVAHIDRGNKKIIVYLRESTDPDFNGVTEETLLHETIHAVLTARYDHFNYYVPNKQLRGKKADPAIDQYIAVWKEFKAMVEADADAPAGAKNAANYPDEFITYAMTAPEVQDWMRKKKYQGRTLWQAFKDWVRRVLGMDAEPTWLDAALKVSNDVLDAAKADPADFSVSQKLLAKRNGTLKSDLKAAAPTVPSALPAVAKFTESTAEQMLARAMVTAKDIGKRALNATVFMHDLVDIGVKSGLTSAKGFNDLMGAKDQIRNRLEERIDEIMSRASGLKDQPAAEQFIRDSTLQQKWGYGDAADPVFARRFNALSASAQDVVKDVFKVGQETYAEVTRLGEAEINNEYDELIKRYPKNAVEYEKERQRDLKRHGRAMPKRDGPYAPLKRFGDHVVVAKSKAYLDAEANNDQKAMDKLIDDKDGIHYVVEFFDTAGAADARRKQLEGLYPSAISSSKQESFKRIDELPWSGIAKIKTAIDGAPDTKHKEAMSRLATSLYLRMLSESSARKSELKRKGVAGAGDMFRAFASQGRSNAHFIASMTKTKDINRQITAMRNEAHNAPQGTRDDATRVLNEIVARYNQGLDYKETPWVDKALRASSLWMLLSSPAYYLQNATQTYMVTLPVLGGKYGDRAFTELNRAYGDVARFVGKMGSELDVNRLPVSAAEKKMLIDLRDKGKLDITIASDLGRWASGAADQGPIAKVVDKLYHAAGKVEALNRITTALAAYRLSSGNAEYAGDMVDMTQGNYAGNNAPRFFHANGAAKLMTQFRKYQLVQISLMGRLLHDSFKGASAEERSAARRALAWVFTQQAIFTGVKGLPIPAALWMIVAAVGGDDDKDWERNFRKWIGDDDLATLLIRGVPAWMGLDISNKIGMGNAFSILPYSDIEFSKKGYKEAVFGASGAFIGGMGGQLFDGLGKMADGNYYKGVEALMPRGLRDGMAGWRLATEGVTTGRNDTVLSADEISVFDGLMKAVGLPTTKITKFNEARNDLYQLGEHFKARDSSVKDAYANAVKSGDTDEAAATRAEWVELQASKKRWAEEMAQRGLKNEKLLEALKQRPLSTLLKAPQEKAKREAPWAAAGR